MKNESGHTGMRSFLELMRNRLHVEGQTLLLLAAFVVLFLVFGVSSPSFLTFRNISSMAFLLPELGLMTLGMVVTMVIGGIDLSINDTANLSAALSGLFLMRVAPLLLGQQNMTLMLILAVIVGMLAGLLCGLINGLLIGRMRIPAILATLGTLTLYRGITVGLTRGKSLSGFPDQLAVIGNGTLVGVPISFLIFIVAAIVLSIVLQRTVLGFEAIMTGSNETAARFSGIKTERLNVKIYAISGVLGAVAGIVIMSRINSVAYEYGTRTYIILTILIAVLSGVQPGIGRIFNVVFAVFILQMLSTGFNMLLIGVTGSTFFRDFAWGFLFLVFFIVPYFVNRKKRRGDL
jgi:simple sugar transport system permease protein